MNLADVIEGLVEERGLDKEKIINIICDGMVVAYSKKYPTISFQVIYNKKTGNVEVFVDKKVVNAVQDDEHEISLRKAKTLEPSCKIDDTIKVPFDENIGRIEILTAKQVIAGKIRELEFLAVYDEFKDKQGTVITGMVHKRERAGYAVKIGEATAFLPNESIIPGEIVKVGYPIKALLKDVLTAARGDYQLFLDRASAEFVKKLLEIEIPEIYEGIVEIKKIVRIPGYKTKAVVASTRKEIDPVGTCVGVGGARIKPILRELGQEKIDLIQASDSLENLVKSSLKPAEIDKVEQVDDTKVLVYLSPDQRSFAIGKGGQNINLASKLVEYDIQLQDLAIPQQSLNFLGDQEEDESDVLAQERDENEQEGKQ